MTRLLLTLLIFSISGCLVRAQKLDEPQKEDPSVENVSELTIEEIFGFGQADMATPDPIPADVLPEVDVYTINTRIIIEGQPTQGDDQTEGMWWARRPKDVLRDIRNAEMVYKDVGLKIHVSELSYKEWNSNVIDHFFDANSHPFVMTIVYMLPNGFIFDGYSSAPWEKFNRGIVIGYHANEWTVAHEMGHYFGLLHPFEGDDFVDDTPDQNTKFCTGKINTPNCRNIMQYCSHLFKEITPGQIERMTRFIRAKRLTHLSRDVTDIFLRGKKVPDLK